MDASPARPPARPDRTLLIIVGVIAALVIIALVVVFTRGEPQSLDESTPEGVVQRYSAAVIDGDEETAKEYLVDELAEGCVRLEGPPVDGMRVTLVETEERDESADVRVLMAISYGGGGPLGPDESQEEGEFDLVREGDEWRIETAPWPLTICQPEMP
ncbi:hypothetical protein BCL57_001210 [Agromyces flavus]|uniref:Lipoprotein LpqB N-terminal domain-containing protein n=1 Tax=Agromyces flavus TaxID=589382 RepID=A0A1H1ZEB9_9MICO|nr:hypothetical protein [Agromyces flavus]MCP2367056.1 hypothetical protein [Agromyces flavus]GGI46488.1 hypothetical protein GCM10010932_14870 [Agromyces flavus]SDT32135.1 hypothetical protein SAMN04489721_3135 [Agromyces flavus]